MLTEIWEETGEKPPALASKPQLKETWVIPYRVWQELTGSRNFTAGGPAEIPFSEFYMWACAHEYSTAEMRAMWEDLHKIDKAWLNESFKKTEADREAKAAAKAAKDSGKPPVMR